MPFVNPTGIREVVGIQSGKELCLIAEILVTSPERDTRLVPCGRENGVLTLRAVDREEIEGLMMGIVQTDRYDDVSSTDVCPFGERLLDPELLQLNLSAFLRLLFPFSAFLVLFLVGDTITAMLELNLGTECPPFTEVVA